jgi:hypothetical protein
MPTFPNAALRGYGASPPVVQVFLTAVSMIAANVESRPLPSVAFPIIMDQLPHGVIPADDRYGFSATRLAATCF